MWRVFLDHLLSHIVQVGTLRVTYADGSTRRYGAGAPELGVTVKDPRLPARIVRSPNLAIGEAYSPTFGYATDSSSGSVTAPGRSVCLSESSPRIGCEGAAGCFRRIVASKRGPSDRMSSTML